MAQRISLVLGSGGARGLAHIGVIHALEERGFEIRSIVGCSMGALIGGFHAAGRLSAYEDWVSELSEWDILRFLDISLTARRGMMKGDLIMNKLRSLIGDQQIEELPVRFTAVATDIESRKEVWISEGDLFTAIRASIAIPGIFTPQELGARTLVDGGLLNPLPVAPATDDRTALTIAVSLAGPAAANPYGPSPPEEERRTLSDYRKRIDDFLARVQTTLGVETEDAPAKERVTLSDVLFNSFYTMQEAIARYHLATYPPDVLIEIPSNTCDIHEFYKARKLIHAGRYWTSRALENIVSEVTE